MFLLRNVLRTMTTQKTFTRKLRPEYVLRDALKSGNNNLDILCQSIQYFNPRRQSPSQLLLPYKQQILENISIKIKQLNKQQIIDLFRNLSMLNDERYATVLLKAFLAFKEVAPIKEWNSFEFFYYWKVGTLLFKWKPSARYILHNCIEAAQTHIETIGFNSLFSVLTLMDEVTDLQMKTSERPKYRKLIEQIEKRTMKGLEEEEKLTEVDQRVLNAPHFYMILVKMGFLTNHKNEQLYEKIELKAIKNVTKAKKQETFKTLLIFSNFLMGFGVGSMRIVDEIYHLYMNDPSFKKQVDTYDANFLGRFCSRYCSFQSSQLFKKFQWDRLQNGIMVLRKSKNTIQKVYVHPMIKILEPLTLTDDYYSHVQVLMPEVFKRKSNKRMSDGTFNVDNNEFRSLVKEQLMELKVPILEEAIVASRKADFVVGNEYIVEVDGDFHFDPATREDNAATKLRNFMFLTAGYRVLVFRLPDYHAARKVNLVREYIRQRLNAMKDPDVIMAM